MLTEEETAASPYWAAPHARLYCDHVRKVLRQIATGSINMAMTSPPYYGLRDYQTEPQLWDGNDPACQHEFQTRHYSLHAGRGDAQKSAKYSEQEPIPDKEMQDELCAKCGAWRGELGQEPNPDMFIGHLMPIFDEIWRVLTPDGTLWVNFGDSYNRARKGSGGTGLQGDNAFARLKKRAAFKPRRFDTSEIPENSLCMVPERFAIAMIERGWILRSKIVWHKPNSMPSSITDRFATDWEYLFFFTKSNETLFWTNSKTGEIVSKQPKTPNSDGAIEGEDWDWAIRKKDGITKYKKSYWHGHSYYFNQQYRPYSKATLDELERYKKSDYKGESLKDYMDVGVQEPRGVKQRTIESVRNNVLVGPKFGGNKAAGYGSNIYSGNGWEPADTTEMRGSIVRTVWSIMTESYPGKHYATYPVELCRRAIEAGCPEYVCNKCGRGRQPKYKEIRIDTRPGLDTGNGKSGTLDDPNAALHNSELSTKRQKTIRVPDGLTDCGCGAGWHAGVVLDLFCGSGATGVAALRLHRDIIGIDVSADYCNQAIERLKREAAVQLEDF